METWALDIIRTVVPLILGGSAWVGWGQYKKAKAEARKTMIEADKLKAGIDEDTDVAAAKAMREAVDIMRDAAADANKARQRAEESENSVRSELSKERAATRAQWGRINALEAADRLKDREIRSMRDSIDQLASKLLAARRVVETLMDYIKRHNDPSTGDLPVVDYSIFEPIHYDSPE